MKLFKKSKKKVSRNTLEIKYTELLERHNKYLEKQIDRSEELNHYKELCESQQKEIKELRKEVAKNGK